MQRVPSHVWRWLAGGMALAVLATAAVLTLRGLGFWSELEPGRVRPLVSGDQEIAWIAPATSGETWERLVKALRLLAKQCRQNHGTAQDLLLTDERAFLLLTADVPEVGLRFADGGTLWVRWYKLSGNKNLSSWIDALARRSRPPLAIAGGETSDRALALAEILARRQGDWPGPAPLLLITTATAERYLPPDRPELKNERDRWPKLMAVYPGRTFRFCFTNPRVVEAVLDFVHQHPETWPHQLDKAKPDAALVRPPFFLFTYAWLDDSYSQDLAFAFQRQFSERVWGRFGKDTTNFADEDNIHYGVGGFYQPNPREELAIGLFLNHLDQRGDQPQLLVLPTGTQRARRFLRTLCSRAPKEVRNLVVANGDSISFNNVYRDRDLIWNIQDVPVPLVFFSHRDPIDRAAGFGAREGERSEGSSTQDLLLFRDLFEALVLADHDGSAWSADAEAVLGRLRSLAWAGDRLAARAADGRSVAFFDAEGNRTAGTGEHIVWLRPLYEKTRVRPEAELSVWRTGAAGQPWRVVGAPMQISYDRTAEEGSVHDGR